MVAFSGLMLDKVGTGDTLQATEQRPRFGDDEPIAIVAASVAQLAVTTQPPASVTAGKNFGLDGRGGGPLRQRQSRRSPAA